VFIRGLNRFLQTCDRLLRVVGLQIDAIELIRVHIVLKLVLMLGVESNDRREFSLTIELPKVQVRCFTGILLQLKDALVFQQSVSIVFLNFFAKSAVAPHTSGRQEDLGNASLF
jgi:hypothetical protein